MLTPTPEWQIGEHHIYAPMTDVYEALEIPSEEDFEAQAWQNLLADARNYAVDQTSFLVIVFGANNVLRNDQEVSALTDSRGQMLAAWDDPRTESAFPYVHPRSKDNDDKNGEIKGSLNSILNQGLMINRPDLIAALNALGVKSVPISFYYLDQSRQRPFLKTSDALLKSCLLYTSPSPRDLSTSRMPSSA